MAEYEEGRTSLYAIKGILILDQDGPASHRASDFSQHGIAAEFTEQDHGFRRTGLHQ